MERCGSFGRDAARQLAPQNPRPSDSAGFATVERGLRLNPPHPSRLPGRERIDATEDRRARRRLLGNHGRDAREPQCAHDLSGRGAPISPMRSIATTPTTPTFRASPLPPDLPATASIEEAVRERGCRGPRRPLPWLPPGARRGEALRPTLGADRQSRQGARGRQRPPHDRGDRRSAARESYGRTDGPESRQGDHVGVRGRQRDRDGESSNRQRAFRTYSSRACFASTPTTT